MENNQDYARRSMKATIAVIVVVLCIIVGFAVVLFLLRPQSLEAVITDTLKESNWTVTDIEKMEDGKDLELVPVDDVGVEKKFHQLFGETIIKYVKDEAEMGSESALYTVHIAGKENSMTVSFDEKGQVHFNLIEKTYEIAQGDLYTFIKTQYESKAKAD